MLRAGDAPPEVAEAHGEFAEWIERAVGDTWAGAWEEAPSPFVPLPFPIRVRRGHHHHRIHRECDRESAVDASHRGLPARGRRG